MKINMNSIMSKLNIKGFADGVDTSVVADRAGEELIDCIIDAIASSGFSNPESLVDRGNYSFTPSLIESRTSKNGSKSVSKKDIYSISVNMGNKHRDSLVPTKYDGVDNIYALLNNGYDANRIVRGIWHGVKISSLAHRDPTEFMQMAASDFMTSHSKEYTIINLEIGGDYE